MDIKEYQKCFIDCIEHHFSRNDFGLPYNEFIKQFADGSYSFDTLYEIFCLGIDYGSKKIKRSDLCSVSGKTANVRMK